MPEDDMQEEVHYDKDGRKYYIGEEDPDEDPERESRFCATAEGVKFYKADPITEEERREAEELWDAMSLPGTSKGKIKK
jgi:hypothetical protein